MSGVLRLLSTIGRAEEEIDRAPALAQGQEDAAVETRPALDMPEFAAGGHRDLFGENRVVMADGLFEKGTLGHRRDRLADEIRGHFAGEGFADALERRFPFAVGDPEHEDRRPDVAQIPLENGVKGWERAVALGVPLVDEQAMHHPALDAFGLVVHGLKSTPVPPPDSRPRGGAGRVCYAT